MAAQVLKDSCGEEYGSIMQKRPGSRIRKGKTLTSATIILIALLIVIILGLASTGMLGTNLFVENPILKKDVGAQVSVVGEDVVVFIACGEDAADLTEVIICIEGVRLSDQEARQAVVNNTCTFSGAARGVAGERDVSMKGVFSDGSVTSIRCSKLNCV